MAAETVRIKGFRELQRALNVGPKEIKKDFRKRMGEMAEPVRRDAANMAERIGNVTGAWAEMRTGVTTNVVYVAPRQRGTRSATMHRPNLATLLMDRAMQPALDAHENDVLATVGEVLDDFARGWAR